MENPQNTGNQYFISMTDMLLGLLIVFLVIVGYLAISFSQSLEKAKNADDAMAKAEAAQAAVAKAQADLAAAKAETAQANKAANQAEQEAEKERNRANRERQRANELQSILMSVDQTRVEILRIIQRELASYNFDVDIDEKTGVVRLPEAELFKTAQFTLTEQGKRNINILKKVLEEVLPCYTISKNEIIKTYSKLECKNRNKIYVDAFLVEGHADSQPVKANNLFKDNQELSTKRAINAYNLLFNSNILSSLTNSNSEFILSVSGYGANRPLCIDRTTNCFRKNRRIDLRLVMELPSTQTTTEKF